MNDQVQHQMYRFKGGADGRLAPEWLRRGECYEGDLSPASQGAPGDAIRLVSPLDRDLCCMVRQDEVEEV